MSGRGASMLGPPTYFRRKRPYEPESAPRRRQLEPVLQSHHFSNLLNALSVEIEVQDQRIEKVGLICSQIAVRQD